MILKAVKVFSCILPDFWLKLSDSSFGMYLTVTALPLDFL